MSAVDTTLDATIEGVDLDDDVLHLRDPFRRPGRWSYCGLELSDATQMPDEEVTEASRCKVCLDLELA